MSIIPFVILFFLALIISLIVGLIKYRKTFQQNPASIPLKDYGNKIMVDISKCEIKTKEYYEDGNNERLPSRIDIIDSLYRSKSSNGSNATKKSVSVVIYRHTYSDGQVVEYRSAPIYLPKELIRYSLLGNQEATLYVDPSNRTNYYLEVPLG
jgi:hypothetical protein